mmetsp:Transcript_44580/g.129640  ORF Transcript_44580/g.129640 Transcript_44580/m.129640 type:complete len:405 (-) Transcript_44580:3551-4765(-)
MRLVALDLRGVIAAAGSQLGVELADLRLEILSLPLQALHAQAQFRGRRRRDRVLLPEIPELFLRLAVLVLVVSTGRLQRVQLPLDLVPLVLRRPQLHQLPVELLLQHAVLRRRVALFVGALRHGLGHLRHDLGHLRVQLLGVVVLPLVVHGAGLVLLELALQLGRLVRLIGLHHLLNELLDLGLFGARVGQLGLQALGLGLEEAQVAFGLELAALGDLSGAAALLGQRALCLDFGVGGLALRQGVAGLRLELAQPSFHGGCILLQPPAPQVRRLGLLLCLDEALLRGDEAPSGRGGLAVRARELLVQVREVHGLPLRAAALLLELQPEILHLGLVRAAALQQAGGLPAFRAQLVLQALDADVQLHVFPPGLPQVLLEFCLAGARQGAGDVVLGALVGLGSGGGF